MLGHSRINIITLLMLAGRCAADTVLGGIVDYLPQCYAYKEAQLYVEYNGGHCYRVFAPGQSYRNVCSCDIESSRRQMLHDDGYGKCTWVMKIDHYKSDVEYDLFDTTKSPYVPSDLELEKMLVFSQYHDGPNLPNDNDPVVQGFSIPTKNPQYLGISLWRGIKMIRFKYLPTGQRDNWSQGVQLRFTDDLKKRLAKRDLGDENTIYFFPSEGMIHSEYDIVLNVKCFMLTGLVPFDRRTAGHHFIDCLKLQRSRSTHPPLDDENSQNFNKLADIINCEQGTNLQSIDTSAKDFLVDALKHIATLGVSFIPVVGPFLSIGLDVALSLIEDPAKFKSIMTSAGVTGSDEAFKLLVELAGKSIKKL